MATGPDAHGGVTGVVIAIERCSDDEIQFKNAQAVLSRSKRFEPFEPLERVELYYDDTPTLLPRILI